jgi:hypothetical protein
MITRSFTIGDRLVSLLANLYRPGGSPVVLGPAETVVFRMLSAAGIVKVADQAAVIITRGSAATNTPAQVRYDWAAADVDTAGVYTAWFIRVSGGETEHFPPQDPDSPEFEIVIEART